MSPTLSRLGLVAALTLTSVGFLRAQSGGGFGADPAPDAKPVKPTGPAAKKADDLIRSYTARIEKEIEGGRKEVERLRAELHELIDLRHEMTAAIADLHGELAAKGVYGAGPILSQGQAAAHDSTPARQAQSQGMVFRRDLIYGLGSALPTNPTPEQREQLRRLAPREDVKRMIERLRSEVEETRTEIDQLAYRLLELREGVPTWRQGVAGMGGGIGGGMGGGVVVPWFGSMGLPMQGGMM